MCAFIFNNPRSPLATADCDNGGISNAVECAAGTNPLLQSDDSVGNGDCSEFVIYECPDKRICVGGTAQLVVNGGISWTWSPTTGLDNPFSDVPKASPTTTTIYTVTGTDVNGCTASEEVVVTVVDQLKVYGGEDQTICDGQTAQLDGQGGVQYQWSPTRGLSDPTIANPVANPTTTTTYTVTVTSSVGCTGTAQVTISTGGLDIDVTPATSTTCGNESVQLNASGGTTYQWAPSIGLSDINIANPIASPTVTTTYSVTVTNGNGCSDTRDMTIFVNSDITVSAGEDRVICGDTGAQLNASGGVTYLWSPSNGLNDPSINNPIATPTSTTTYTVTVTDENGCTGTDQVLVTVGNFVAEACEDKEMCVGESTRLLVSSGVAYQWSPANTLDNPSIAAPNANPAHTTTYFVTVTNRVGCTSVDEVTLYVHTNLSANAGADISECPNVGSQLQAIGGMSYEWNPKESLSDPFIANPIANPSSTTIYTVTIMDFNGCIVTDQVTYEVSTDCTQPVNCTEDIVAMTESCVGEDNLARICLPFTIEELNANYVLSTSAGEIVPDHGCDFIPVYVYPYAILPNFGNNGTYTITAWEVGDQSYTGEVSSMEELTAWMQRNDPSGNWFNDSPNFFIQGGNPASTYGMLSIMHEETWIESTISPSYTGKAQGTLLTIDMMGKNSDQLTITRISDGCTDEITIRRCETIPRCSEIFVAELYETSIENCTDLGTICLPINVGHIFDFDISVDGQPYAGNIHECSTVASFTYTYFSIPDQGGNGPYEILEWEVNNQIFKGNFSNLDELIDWMNTKDLTGNWSLDPSTSSIAGGNIASEYGKLIVRQTMTRSTSNLDINTKFAPTGTEFTFAEGSHQVQLTNTKNGCINQFEAIVSCSSGLASDVVIDTIDFLNTTNMLLDVVANDRAKESQLTITKDPQYGRVIVNEDNTLEYEANEGYCNSEVADYFSYKICNNKGCDEVVVEVSVKCQPMKVNSGFSPNNDGINDLLTIEGLEHYPNNELIIFNRWGAEIFKQVNYEEKWDGSYDGLPLPDGTYFYILKDGIGGRQSGYIQINR